MPRSLTVPLALLALLALAPASGAGGSTPVKTVGITATAAPWVVLGSHLGITGSVKPNSTGLALALQERTGGGWTTLATKTVAGPTFGFLILPTNSGTPTFQVVVARGGPFADNSAPVVVEVQRLKVSVAGMYRLRLKINVPDPTGAAGCGTTFTQVVFGNLRILGP